MSSLIKVATDITIVITITLLQNVLVGEGNFRVYFVTVASVANYSCSLLNESQNCATTELFNDGVVVADIIISDEH